MKASMCSETLHIDDFIFITHEQKRHLEII